MKKSREEDLARRYCEYLGLSLDVTRCPNGKILAVKVHPTGLFRSAGFAEYQSFKSFFFGNSNSYGMCEKLPDIYYIEDNTWNRINNIIIPATTLDELEMQLAVRGF